MIKTTKLDNGQTAGVSIAEIITVPYYELYNKDLDRANHLNQVVFTRLISSFHRKSELNNTSFEILWQSIKVANQTYEAQIKIFYIVRQFNTEEKTVINNINDIMRSLKKNLEIENYILNVFETAAEFNDFEISLKNADTSTILAVSKKERVIANALYANGGMYYNDVLQPSEDVNMSVITNAMTLCADSIVSMQIIPTEYEQNEIIAIEEGKNLLNYYISDFQLRQRMRVDSSVSTVADAYEYYSNAKNEMLFYYNFIVYSSSNSASDIANVMLDSMEVEGKTSESAMDIIDISKLDIAPWKNIIISPWIVSDSLIYKQRETKFWNEKNAPKHLMRLKYLMTTNELKSVFKLPLDNEKAIGLESKKVLSNRVKLQDNIISDENFKIGIIQSAGKSDGSLAVHAGIPLNDFTKHALIVGMPGSGKTNFSLGLLLQFWNEFHIPFLAIEPTKNEYRSLIDGISDLQVFTPGKNNISPYIINPFLPPKGVTVESYVPSLMCAFKASFSMPSPLPDLFLSAINDCYNEYGWRNDSTFEDPEVERFGLYEFIRVFKRKIQNMDYKGEFKSNIETAGVVRLISLIEQNSNIYDTIKTIPIEDLLSKPTVIELNAINNKEQKSLIMALLLILICVYTKNNVAGDGKLKNIMLIDEAHVLLSKDSSKGEDSADSQGSTIEALEDMIAEIRSYGTGIIIADQSPTKVGRNIIANTNIKIIFKLVEKENKDSISTATNMNEAYYDSLGRLGVGEALLHYGRVYAPLHIKTYNLKEKAKIRTVITDQEIASLTTYWDSHSELLIPYNECKYSKECAASCNFKTKSNADYIASKLINTYFYGLQDRKAFLSYLMTMDASIKKIFADIPSISEDLKLINCIKIKFLRKTLLIKDFSITKKEYNTIIEHKNYLNKEIIKQE